MPLTNCITNLKQEDMKKIEKDLFSLIEDGKSALNDMLSKGLDVAAIQEQTKTEGKKNLLTKSIVVKNAETVPLPADYYDVTAVKAQKQNHNFYFNYRNYKISGSAEEPFVEVGKAKDGQLFKKIKVTYRIEDKNPPKNMHVELTKLQKLKNDPKAFNELKRNIDSDFGAVYEKIDDVTTKIADDFNIAIEKFNDTLANPQTDSEKLAANILNQALSGNFSGAISSAINASKQSPLGITNNFLQTGVLPAGLTTPPNKRVLTRIARSTNSDTVEILDEDATIVKVSVVKPGTNFFGGTISPNQYNYDTDENILTVTSGLIYPKIKVTYTIEEDIEAITPASQTLPDDPLDVCKDVPNIEVKKVTETITNARTKIKEIKTVTVKKDKAKQAIQPGVKAEPQPSIKEEETVIVKTEQPVQESKPEAAIVDPVSNEVKPVTRSIQAIEEELFEFNKKIVSKFVDSLTGIFGDLSLNIPKQYPDFSAEYYLENKKVRQFFKDEFRSKDQYKVMRSKLKEYRDPDEGIKKGISILDTQKVREYGFDAGLTQDDLDFYERFLSAELEREQIDNEKQFYYSILSHYITVLADSSSRGVIAVFGDIKMPQNKILDTGYELQNPTKYIGTSNNPRLGNNGLELVDAWNWRTCPEGRSENYLKNYFEFKKTRAWIFTDTYGPSATVATMSAVRAANFFGILLPEAMLIAQQHHDLFLEYKAATDLQIFDILPSTSDWNDFAKPGARTSLGFKSVINI